MGFEPFFSNRRAPSEASASHIWRPALPPIDRPIAQLETAGSAEAPTSASRRTIARVSDGEASRGTTTR